MRRWPKKFAAKTPVASRITNSRAGRRARECESRRAPRGATGPARARVSGRASTPGNADHPDRDAERHPDEQSGDQVALHRWRRGCARCGGRRGAGLRGGSRGGARVSALVSLFGSPAASVLESPLASPFASVRSAGSGRGGSPSFAGAGLAPLPLKSVAYQPLPFNWKPAAETFLTSAVLVAGRARRRAAHRRISAGPRVHARKTSNGIRRSASHPRLDQRQSA